MELEVHHHIQSSLQESSEEGRVGEESEGEGEEREGGGGDKTYRAEPWQPDTQQSFYRQASSLSLTPGPPG